MFCSHCGQPLEESDLFCSKCGQKIEEFAQEKVQDKPQQEESLPKKISSADPDASSTNESASLAYPYYHAIDPSAVPPKKKNRWVIPVVIAVAVLVLAIFIVGGILLYMLITTLTLEETTNISAVSQGPAVVNGKELSDYLGLTVEDLKNGSGVLLTEYDGTYTNLDGSVMVTLNESTGLIDMLVASDRDVGFTVCGVSVGMDREQAKSTAQAYVSDLEESRNNF